MPEMSLERNPLYCLDWNVKAWLGGLFTLRVGGDRLMTVHDEMPHKMTWDLVIESNFFDQYIIQLEVPNFVFCLANDGPGSGDVLLMWDFRPVLTGSPTMFPMLQNDICSISPMPMHDINGSEIEREINVVTHSPFVVIATDDFKIEQTPHHYPDMCRQAWEHNLGVTVALENGATMQLVSMGVGNTAATTVAITFTTTHDTESDEEMFHTNTDTGSTQNITCILLSKYSYLLSEIPPIPRKIKRTCPVVRGFDTDQTSLPPQTKPQTTEQYRQHTDEYRHHTPIVQTTTALMQSTTKQVTSPPGSRPITVVASVVGTVFFAILVGFLLKKCQLKMRNGNLQANVHTRDAHVLTRSGLVTRRTFPAVLGNIRPTSSYMSSHVAAARRPLPALPPPYWEIRDHTPAHLYNEIPDNIAAAQRPLPALPRTPPGNVFPTAVRSTTRCNKYNTLPTITHSHRGSDHAATSRRSLPPLHHPLEDTDCDSDSLDDDTIRFYAACAEPSLPTVTKTVVSRRTYQHNSVATLHSRQFAASRPHVLYDVRGASRYNFATTYGAPDTRWPKEGTVSSVVWRRSLPILPYVNWPAHISTAEEPETTRCQETFHLPDTYWPWEVPGEGTRNTPRRASLPLVTLPNTYWPWGMQGEGNGI
ncbi:Hypp4876 [Branchiostoma lanceolatum]|uniref:Hypp4876 protein n=1 Tax=Branchiostoma lanceolatum TaxID=7740 RepID=A0A8K0F057_BRALA|nr:Hypp4876 [Branchiostoma lanceolatum]